ncbi:DUF1772 domain-containing protein [Nocardia aurantia]|uniref:DUF1772 domain-containing protein n=1 Tax=Nocardia aurantia TaxID=2585199 RepID=A0A7K0DXS1_9NOCA|nr:DUF1772 domain-containing protein [Nocardia aurantia]MQY30132.1 hypothetical protein [Nocardia aurantia]
MLTTIGQIAAAVAILANAVVYGTDACAALIMRSSYRKLDDAALTTVAGWGHYYGDRRMPPFGIGGVVGTLATLVLAAAAGHAGAAIGAGIALVALLSWLAFYARVAKPINTAQKEAARTGIIPPNARALQDKWDSILGFRVGLQAVALAGLCAALALL